MSRCNPAWWKRCHTREQTKNTLYNVQVCVCVYRNHIQCAYNNCGCLPPVCITPHTNSPAHNMHNNCHCWIKWFFSYCLWHASSDETAMEGEQFENYPIIGNRENVEEERGTDREYRLTRYLTRKTIFPLDLGHSFRMYLYLKHGNLRSYPRTDVCVQYIWLCTRLASIGTQRQLCDRQKSIPANHIIYKIQN